MASYTIELRAIVDSYSIGKYGLDYRQKIELGRKKLFDFEYPLFDSNYRGVFETHFINNFYMREIGFETERLFKMRLENWLLINMPYYNDLFKSTLIQYNPLYNTDLTETFDKTSDRNQDDTRVIGQDSTVDTTANQDSQSHATGNQNSKDFNRNISSDTPQSRLQLTTTADGTGIIEYANNITEDSNSGTVDTTTDSTTSNDETSNSKGSFDSNDKYDSAIKQIDEYVKKVVGKSGNQNYSQMILDFRKTFLRIEKQIFDEMNNLFMLVY